MRGHTDDQPLTSLRYRDNFELSRERAVSVVRLMQPTVQGTARPRANGAGSSEPRYKPNRLRRTARAIDGSRLSTARRVTPMFAFLKSRVFLVVLGLILLALFIWFAGPLFAFADWRPLESVTARLIAIGLVVLFWVGRNWSNGCAPIAPATSWLRRSCSSLAESRPSADAVAARTLRGSGRHPQAKRRTGHSLYDLPCA